MNAENNFKPFGERAVLWEFDNVISPDTNRTVVRCAEEISTLPGILEITPGYRSILIEYDISRYSYKQVCETLLQRQNSVQLSSNSVLHEIPVFYGGEYGPDIEAVARHNNISVAEVIALHSATEYPVYMVGFLPGFPYLGGMDSRLATPRLKTPRVKISAGSVGIAGSQTGIYPIDSPGGWQIIGKTDIKLFDLQASQPFLIKSGDHVRFVPII